MKIVFLIAALTPAWLVVLAAVGIGQDAQPTADGAGPVRGSLVEDRAAVKLLEAGDARYDADEFTKAVEVWQSVIERYPRSKVRFQGHMRLGNYLLKRDRAYDRARIHFEAAAGEDNRDEDVRAEATLKLGICFYEARNFGKCFTVMREVIEKFPVSAQVNQAYYYIGLGHFQLGHYSRAIDALEKVGTALSSDEGKIEKVEMGKRLFVRIDDADLAALEAVQNVKVRCETLGGDAETVECFTVGRNVRVVLGSVLTALGKPVPNNGQLEVRGDDKVKVSYLDAHTGDRQFDRPVIKEIFVVGDAVVEITDGAFSETLRGVVLGREVNVQIADPDHDLTDTAEQIMAVVEVYREKTADELEAEQAKAVAQQVGAATEVPTVDRADQPEVDPFKRVDGVEITLVEAKITRDLPTLPKSGEPGETEARSRKTGVRSQESGEGAQEKAPADIKPATKGGGPEKKTEKTSSAKTSTKATLTAADEKSVKTATKEPEKGKNEATKGQTKASAKKPADAPASGVPASNEPSAPASPHTDEAAAAESRPAKPATPVDDGTIHSGVFRAIVSLVKSDSVVENDNVLQALPGDMVRITYLDQRNTTDAPRTVSVQARTMEGNLGGVRVTRAQISDQELRIQTQLKTSSALTNIGNRYKEFGLKKNAEAKYAQALTVCEDISDDARRLGGHLLEDTYVQLWKIYYEMDKLELAAAMCQRLQQEFPNSGFVDDALLQLADVVRKQGDLQRAIGIYDRLVNMKTSQLRGEAQFGIAECYETMARQATGPGAAQLHDRAFQEYKKVFDGFPESGRVGEAVAKMANYYYQQKDYARAVDIFETVLADHPDAKFLDVILFNYGRCLYRMERKGEARRQFDQLIGEFPESPLAADAKKISEALAKGGF
ncbi:MAG TPA: tetratricopeptide repeat protein [Pirellulales bacterium]|nr:tetratricopeptide repeat protein [Pirellulales bacterium]